MGVFVWRWGYRHRNTDLPKKIPLESSLFGSTNLPLALKHMSFAKVAASQQEERRVTNPSPEEASIVYLYDIT